MRRAATVPVIVRTIATTVVLAVLALLLGSAPAAARPARLPAQVPPVLVTVSPAAGPTAGGTAVVLSGAGLDRTTDVLFGDVPAAEWRVESALRVVAVSPMSRAGTVPVRVVTGSGTSPDLPTTRFTSEGPDPVQATVPVTVVRGTSARTEPPPPLTSFSAPFPESTAEGVVVRAVADGVVVDAQQAARAGRSSFALRGTGCTADGCEVPYDLDVAVEVVERPSGTPDDPPPLDAGAATPLIRATEFLWSGPSAVQTGVAPGTIEAERVAVLRGRVIDEDGQPLAGVAVRVLGHPELGRTVSRADGEYDLAVNGGGELVLDLSKEGRAPAQRRVPAPWQDYAVVPDVALVPYDAVVTEVALPAGEVQVARGSRVSDSDGERQATLLFPAGTTAEMVLPDGSRQVLGTLHVRATEYTAGPQGPARMPGELPPASAYTYAVELSVDEAVAAGAQEVRFDRPVALYVEDFLGFPVGGVVPAGWYDREQARWRPSANGRVVQVVAEAGGLAEVDTTGDGVADDDLGLDEAERRRLAELYEPGARLWRAPVEHFTPWDLNWPYGPPSDAEPPDDVPTPDEADPRPEEQCEQRGSVIGCEGQTLGESTPVAGTGMRLSYDSSRVPGRTADHVLDIPLTGARVPASLKRVELTVAVAGRTFRSSYPRQANLRVPFRWDGEDAYGRRLQGRHPVTVTVGYVYDLVYQSPDTFAASFGRVSRSGVAVAGSRDRSEVTLSRTTRSTVTSATALGGWDARGAGLGGWTLDAHHAYDPVGVRVHLGDGRSRSARGVLSISTQGPRLRAKSVQAAPDGSVYVLEQRYARSGGSTVFYAYVWRVHPDGRAEHVAGTGPDDRATGPSDGDGGPATSAFLRDANDIALAPDGSLYVVAFDVSGRLRRIDPQGMVHTVAGGGSAEPEDVPAASSRLYLPEQVAVGQDGSVYLALPFHRRVLRIGPDGVIGTFAGTGSSTAEGVPARSARLHTPRGVSVAPDGSVLVSDAGDRLVRRVGGDGRITTLAGSRSSSAPYGGEGLPATGVRLGFPRDAQVGPDGALYVVERDGNVVRRVDGSGVISTVAGRFGLRSSDLGDGGPALGAQLFAPQELAFHADGSFVVADESHERVRRVTAALPSASPLGHVVPSPDGEEVWVFDPAGRHLRTVDALTGATVRTFSYDGSGQLSAVTDRAGQRTTVERDGEGRATALVAPGGARTGLQLDEQGWLTSVTDPAGGVLALRYGRDGLLTGLTDQVGREHAYTWDALGRLVADRSPGGGTTRLARTALPLGTEVAVTSGAGRTTRYRVERVADGSVRQRVTDPAGAVTETTTSRDRRVVTQLPDGTRAEARYGRDPRFGVQVPLLQRLTVTTPGGRVDEVTGTRSVQLRDDSDLLSVERLEEGWTVNGRTSTRVYDGSTRTSTTTTPAGREQRTVLDAAGRVARLEPGAGLAPRTYEYDARGQLTRVAQGSHEVVLARGADGQVRSTTDALGQVTEYERDPAGRLLGVTRGGRRWSADRDGAGAVTALRLPSGAEHRITWSADGHLASFTVPGGGAYSAEHDADGLRTRTSSPGGGDLAVTYDAAGRDVRQTDPHGTVTRTWATPGATRPASAVRERGDGTTAGVSPRTDGPLLTGAVLTGAVPAEVAHQVDSRFLPISTRVTSGDDVVDLALGWDDDGLLTASGPYALERGGPGGTVSGVTDGTSTVSLSRDGLGQVVERRHEVAGREVHRDVLTRDALGRTARRVTTTGSAGSVTTEYAYDVSGQLVEVRRDGATVERYAYDVDGNRTSRWTPDGGTESATYRDGVLTALGDVPYASDADGSLAARGSDRFRYSLRGELLSADVAAGRVQYAYDAHGRRVARTGPDGTTHYLYASPTDPYQLTAVRGPDGVLVVLHHDEAARLVGLERQGRRYAVVTDELGSPLAVVAPDGTVVEQWQYDAWGRPRAVLDDPSLVLPVAFAGGLADPATGLLRFGQRDYDPEAGRWTARDPQLTSAGQANLYVYAGNAPVDRRDRDGLDWRSWLDDAVEWGERLKDWWEKEETVEEVVDTAQQVYDIENDEALSEPEKAAGILSCMLTWLEELQPVPLTPAQPAQEALERGRQHARDQRDHGSINAGVRRQLAELGM